MSRLVSKFPGPRPELQSGRKSGPGLRGVLQPGVPSRPERHHFAAKQGGDWFTVTPSQGVLFVGDVVLIFLSAAAEEHVGRGLNDGLNHSPDCLQKDRHAATIR